MVIHHTNYYQSWSQAGVIQSWRATPDAAVATARWSGDQTYRNDWKLVNGRTDWLAKSAVAAGNTAQWSGDQTHLNDWKLVDGRIDWLAKSVAAPAGNTALWTMLNVAHISYRNDWQILDVLSNGIAQSEAFVEPVVPEDGGGTSRRSLLLEQARREDVEIIELVTSIICKNLI